MYQKQTYLGKTLNLQAFNRLPAFFHKIFHRVEPRKDAGFECQLRRGFAVAKPPWLMPAYFPGGVCGAGLGAVTPGVLGVAAGGVAPAAG